MSSDIDVMVKARKAGRCTLGSTMHVSRMLCTMPSQRYTLCYDSMLMLQSDGQEHRKPVHAVHFMLRSLRFRSTMQVFRHPMQPCV